MNKNIGRVVFTGVAGSGKSTMLDMMVKKGYTIVEEVARNLIADFNINDQSKLPQNNKALFQSIIEPIQISNYFNNENAIFDRCCVDEIIYTEYFGYKPSKEILEHCEQHRYDKVFLFPPFKEIYKNDDVRKETFEETLEMHEMYISTFNRLGYDVVVVPKIDIESRFNYIHDIMVPK